MKKRKENDLATCLRKDIEYKEDRNRLGSEIKEISNTFELHGVEIKELNHKEEELAEIDKNLPLVIKELKELRIELDELAQKRERLNKNMSERMGFISENNLKEDIKISALEEDLQEHEKSTKEQRNRVDLVKNILATNKLFNNASKKQNRFSRKVYNLKKLLSDKKYDYLSERITKLKTERDEKESKQREYIKKIVILEAEIDAKKTMRKELIDIKKEYRNEMEIANNSRLMSDIFKKIYPAILSNRTLNIIQRTNNILSQMPSQSGQFSIQITDDFEIIIQHKNEERKLFTLSGGETTGLAFALRVALSQEIANCGFLVLDEPTDGVDRERKQIMAKILASQKEVNQLLVISHDDAFDSFAGN